MNAMHIEKQNDIKSYALYFFLYCPLGVLSPLIGQYLSSIGFSGTQVGTVTSLGTASAVFAGMFWGKIFANSEKILYPFKYSPTKLYVSSNAPRA